MIFTVNFGGTVTLSLDEVWPDGDHPENASAYDVADLMGQEGFRCLMFEWDLASGVEIDVDGVPVRT